jgi:hypothetical protein
MNPLLDSKKITSINERDINDLTLASVHHGLNLCYVIDTINIFFFGGIFLKKSSKKIIIKIFKIIS